jgi:hypothetical protein
MKISSMGKRREVGSKMRHKRGAYRQTVSLLLIGSLLFLTGPLPHAHHGPAHGLTEVQLGETSLPGSTHALTNDFEHACGDSCPACAFLNVLRSMELPTLSWLAMDSCQHTIHPPAPRVIHSECLAAHFRVRAPPYCLA